MKTSTMIGVGIAVAGVVAAYLLFKSRSGSTIPQNPRPAPGAPKGSTKQDLINAGVGIANNLVNNFFGQGGGTAPTTTPQNYAALA